MDYINLGHTGLKISRITLGCMSFGSASWAPWVLDEAASNRIIAQAVDLGINMFDTADMYSLGRSEEIVGAALKDIRRDTLVIATKLNAAMSDDPNDRGLSRKHVFAAVDASLRRLGTDHIDLYQIHRFDPQTPLEETLEALDDLVRMGKVLYLGASSMSAWQFMKALGLQRQHGWARFVSMQNHYNLMYREEEREMLPLCRSEGIGVIPWSPLARGRLAGRARTTRAQSDKYAGTLYDATAASDEAIVAAVGRGCRAARRADGGGCVCLGGVAAGDHLADRGRDQAGASRGGGQRAQADAVARGRRLAGSALLRAAGGRARVNPPRHGEGDQPQAGGGGPPPANALAAKGPLHHAASRRGPPPRAGEDLVGRPLQIPHQKSVIARFHQVARQVAHHHHAAIERADHLLDRLERVRADDPRERRSPRDRLRRAAAPAARASRRCAGGRRPAR
jgi:aryl-alcohol dehydrogenase-like predicted oxidoreductase